MNKPRCQKKQRARLTGPLAALLMTATICPIGRAEEELGRLFFTPERRQNLDRQRQLNIQEKEATPEDPTFIINGVVTRSSGKRTVWINGVAQNEREAPSGIAVTTNKGKPGNVVVQAADSSAGSAKVGDTVNRNTGETTDLLNGGRISVKPTVKK